MGDNSFVTELAQAAIATHELFMAYQDAGFTEAQAMELIKAGVAAIMRPE